MLTLTEFFHHLLEKEWELKLKVNLPSALRTSRVEVPSPKGIDSAAQCLFFPGHKHSLQLDSADLRSLGIPLPRLETPYRTGRRRGTPREDSLPAARITASHTRACTFITTLETDIRLNTVSSGAAELETTL